jgi:hypothetical protein
MLKQRYFTGFSGILLLAYFLCAGLNPRIAANLTAGEENQSNWEHPHYLDTASLPLLYYNPEAESSVVSLNYTAPSLVKESFKELKARIRANNYVLVQHSKRYVRNARIRLIQFPATDRIFPFHYFW